MSRVLLLLPGVLFGLLRSSTATAQTPLWSGIIDHTRATDWSGAGVQGGISTYSKICATINPKGSPASPVAPTDVNNAIASCASSYPNGSVVYLNAGSFYYSSGIDFANHSHVVLRGAGADKTFLYFSGHTGCSGINSVVCIENSSLSWSGGWSEYSAWTAGYSQGTTTITLSSKNLLTVGAPIVLDQCNSGLSGAVTSNSNDGCGTGTEADNGNLFFCDIQNTCNTGSSTGNYRTNRAHSEVHIVTGISGSGPYVITLDRGLELPDWSSASSPSVWWADNYVTGDGIENLSIDNGASSGGSHSVGFFWATNCWMTGVRSIRGHTAHVDLFTSAHITIANNYFYGTASPGSGAYGIAETQSGDDLFENNIFQHMTAPDAADGPISGSVYAYNFATNDAYYQSDWLLASDEPHSAGDVMTLYEGNQGLSFNSDDIHGTEDMQTLFRNWYSGQATGLINSGAQPVQFYAYARYGNVIGNVLGTPGQQGTYQQVTPGGNSNPAVGTANSIYLLGWFGFSAGDTNVASTLFRWGNYDVVTGAVRWCGNSSDPGWSTTCGSASEVPTALSIYANAVPSSTALPNSFFLSSKPAFWSTPWSTPPWPAIGPDARGGAGPGGYANNIPAELCWANSSIDASYQNSYAITGASWSGGKATLAVSIRTGDYPSGLVTISGVSPSGYNGTYNFTGTFDGSHNLTSMTYALSSNPGAYASGGTAVYPLVRTFNASTCYGSASTQAPAPPTGLNAAVQ